MLIKWWSSLLDPHTTNENIGVISPCVMRAAKRQQRWISKCSRSLQVIMGEFQHLGPSGDIDIFTLSSKQSFANKFEKFHYIVLCNEQTELKVWPGLRPESAGWVLTWISLVPALTKVVMGFFRGRPWHLHDKAQCSWALGLSPLSSLLSCLNPNWVQGNSIPPNSAMWLLMEWLWSVGSVSS